MIVPVTVCKNLLGFSLKLRIEGGIRRNKARHRKCEIRKNNATSGPRHPGRVRCRRRSGEARDRAGGECQGAKTSGDACGLGRGGAEGLTGEPRPGSRLSLRVWSGERCISTRRSPSQLQPKPRGSPLRLSAAAIFALTGGSRGRYFRRTSEQVRPARTPPVVPPGRVPGPRGHLSDQSIAGVAGGRRRISTAAAEVPAAGCSPSKKGLESGGDGPWPRGCSCWGWPGRRSPRKPFRGSAQRWGSRLRSSPSRTWPGTSAP